MAFNCADHANIIEQAGESIFGNQFQANSYRAHTGTLDALATKQTANIPDLGKCKDLKLYWEEVCSTAVDACADTCDLPVALTDDGVCTTHTIGECSSKSFSVSEAVYDCNEFAIADTVAKKRASVRKSILDDINTKYLAKVALLAGQNLYTSSDPAIVATATETTIPSSYWGLSTLAPYMGNVEDFNGFGGVVLSGSKLYTQDYLSKIGGLDQLDSRIIGALGLEFDNRNVDASLGGSGVYLIDPSAIAFLNYAENVATSPQQAMAQGRGDGTTMPIGWRETWTTEAGFSVEVDVYYQKKCIGLNDISHTYMYRVNWDLANRPASVCDGNTGVLKFVCA